MCTNIRQMGSMHCRDVHTNSTGRGGRNYIYNMHMACTRKLSSKPPLTLVLMNSKGVCIPCLFRLVVIQAIDGCMEVMADIFFHLLLLLPPKIGEGNGCFEGSTSFPRVPWRPGGHLGFEANDTMAQNFFLGE